MSKSIRIIQALHEYNVPNIIVNKFYNMLYRKQDLNDETINLDNSNIVGEITLSGPTYQDYINYIQEVYPNFNISANAYYVLFKDVNVAKEMIRLFGDGTGVIASNVSATYLYGIFHKNTMQNRYGTDAINWQIKSFNELPQFTSIKTLDSECFAYQTVLESIDLTNITKLGSSNFLGCSNLKTLGNTSNITQITGTNNFYECSSLISYTMAPSLTTIPQSTFYNCSSLQSIDLSHVSSFGYAAFSGCESLAEIDLSACSQLSDDCFKNCTSLETVKNIQNLTRINSGCFSGCTLLSTIDLSTCTILGSAVFYNCISLTTLDLRNVIEFSSKTFAGCTSLIHVDFPSVLYFNSSNCGAEFDGCTSLGIGETLELTIGSGMGPRTFYNTKYNKVILHANAQHQIGDYRGSGQYCSFSYMTSCSLIDLSDTVYTTPPDIGSCWDAGVLQTIIYPKTMTTYNRSFVDVAYTVINVIFLSETYVTPNIDRLWAYYRLTNKSSFHIYVKDELIDQYLADENWAPQSQGGISLSSIFRTWSDIPSNITWYTKDHQSVFES